MSEAKHKPEAVALAVAVMEAAGTSPLHYMPATCTEILDAAQSQIDELRKPLLEACKTALDHVTELRDAWMKGALHERDNLGGARSNRNVDVEQVLRAALSQVEGRK